MVGLSVRLSLDREDPVAGQARESRGQFTGLSVDVKKHVSRPRFLQT